MTRTRSTLIAAAAALTMAVAFAPSAEARYGRNAAGIAAGVIGGALIAGALAGPAYAAPVYGGPVYGAPVYGGPVVVDEPECYVVRSRVWSDYHGRNIVVRRTVCE